MNTETYKKRAQQGSVSLIECTSEGYWEVWDMDGKQGEPKRFYTEEEAVEEFGHMVWTDKNAARLGRL